MSWVPEPAVAGTWDAEFGGLESAVVGVAIVGRAVVGVIFDVNSWVKEASVSTPVWIEE